MFEWVRVVGLLKKISRQSVVFVPRFSFPFFFLVSSVSHKSSYACMLCILFGAPCFNVRTKEGTLKIAIHWLDYT